MVMNSAEKTMGDEGLLGGLILGVMRGKRVWITEDGNSRDETYEDFI